MESILICGRNIGFIGIRKKSIILIEGFNLLKGDAYGQMSDKN
jgi:hypothetical protein